MIRLCAFADEAAAPLEEQIEELKKHGINLLELRSIGGKNVSAFTLDEAEKYSKILKEAGIEVWSIGSPLCKTDLDTKDLHLAIADHLFEIAEIFGTKRVRMFSYYKSEGRGDEVIAALREIAEVAKRRDIILCHENEKGIYGDVTERVEEIVSAKIDGMRFVFDPANYIQCGVFIPDAIKKLFGTTDYFHIKDVIRETGELVPSGNGDGFIDGIIDMITASRRDTVMSIEPHLKVFSGASGTGDSQITGKYVYSSNKESFAAAVDGLKATLTKCGYTETADGWVHK